MTDSLYVRLGCTEGNRSLASELMDLHKINPIIGPRSVGSDGATLKKNAADFLHCRIGWPGRCL